METTNSAKNLAGIKAFIEISRTQWSADDIRSGKAHYETRKVYRQIYGSGTREVKALIKTAKAR